MTERAIAAIWAAWDRLSLALVQAGVTLVWGARKLLGRRKY